jgi:hypothetical protein
MQAKFTNKLTSKIVRQLNALSWSTFEMTDHDETFIVLYNSDGDFVGVMKIKFDGFVITGIDQPAFNIFIDKFEVNPKLRGKGWARIMLRWLEWSYNINKITLHYVEPTYDDGASKSFWEHMGFAKNKSKIKNELSKILAD